MDAKQSLTLFRGEPANNTFVWSPFVTKLELRLRLASQAYTLDAGSPRSAPRGKIPYIQLGEDSLGDSTFIIKHLVSKGMLPDLNASITPAQRAQDLAIRALMEDKVYFYTGKEKWCDNYPTMRDGVLAVIPWPMRLVVGFLARRRMVRTLLGQGTLLLNDEEVATLKEEVWESINALLAEARSSREAQTEPFWVLGGEQPTEADATLFGFVVGALICDAAPETARIVRQHPVIVEYADRIRDWYFPDYEMGC